MFGNKLINTNAGGGCTNTVDLYNPFPDGGGVALYQLNGDANDVSGNYNGTASNLNYVAGQFGQGASFNTSNSILTAPRAFSTNSPYSVSGWVKIANGSTTQAVNLAWQITGTNQSQVTVSYDGVSTYILAVNHKFETNSYVGYNFAANDGQWHHYAVTFNGSSANLYIDGSFVKSGLLDPKGDVGSTNYIGGTNVYNGITYYNGLDGLDQVRYFTRALRPYEVEALYTEEYCTPTIVPSEHFNTVLYTGQGGSESITDVGFQPDLVWIKGRETSGKWNVLYDSIRGTNKMLSSNETSAELTYGSVTPTANGFDLGSLAGDLNSSGEDYVAWNFKAGGSAVTNTDGTITSQVSANTEAGFSIVTGSVSSSGFTNTYGHGLNDTPKIVISKVRNDASDWFVSNSFLANNCLKLNTTAVAFSDSAFAQTSTTIKTAYTTSAYNFVAYCFAEVEGFSNFGSYVGNGSTSGPTVITGFEPAFVMIKNSSAIYEWVIVDNKRSVENPRDKELNPNSSAAENGTGDPTSINFLENGFQIISTDGATNQNNGKLIYMAFAADPTTIEPSLEDSFNTVLYSGNSNTQSVTGVGFQPDLIWLKGRNTTQWHGLYDSIRGVGKWITSNATNAEADTAGTTITSFNTDGFSLGDDSNGYGANTSGNTYVAWNWKGAEIPAINSNGSIPSVVSANPAAGFSIVKYEGNQTTGATVGHGLNSAPEFVIIKQLGTAGHHWKSIAAVLGAGKAIYLNLDIAAVSGQFNNTLPTDTVFTLDNDTNVNENNQNHIAYCFAEVAGFSKFGRYTGNAPAGGTGSTIPINCGFEPAFVMIKWTSGSVGYGAWGIWDNKRDTTNPNTKFLQANSSSAELDLSAYGIDFASNGFTVGAAGNDITNISGNSYIYMAFANQF